MAKHMAPASRADEPAASTRPLPQANGLASDAVPGGEPAPMPTPGPERPRRGNLLSNILIVVGVALLVVAGVIFFNNNRNYQEIDEKNERVAEYARLSDGTNEAPQVDWESLKEMNSDIVGWLQVPGTVVNYPVFKAGDNEFYLTHAPDGSDSIGGSVFMDYENASPGMMDMQTIVYGHHMRNGSQFKQIADMDNQELFDGVGTVWYVTEQGAFDMAPLFLYYTDEEDFDVRMFNFENLDAFRAYLNGNLARSVAHRANAEQAIPSITRVFTLSTCNYYDGYGRTLLVCALKSEIPGTPEYDAAQAARAQAAAEQQAQQPAAEEAAAAAEPAPEGEQPADQPVEEQYENYEE